MVALADDLAALGIRLSLGGATPQVRRMLDRSGALDRLGADAVFPSLKAAVEAYQSAQKITSAARPLDSDDTGSRTL